MDEKKINEILRHYSPEAQTVKALEELAELQTELAKVLNGQGNKRALKSEIADVVIMILQMMIIYDIYYENLDNEIAFKLDRQLRRIAEQTELQTEDEYITELIKKKCKTEPQTEYKKWETKPIADMPTENTTCVGVAMALVEDEPQTERSSK